jgi:ankyrin repeat protein
MHQFLFAQEPPRLLGEVQSFIANGGDPRVLHEGTGMGLIHLALDHLDMATLLFAFDRGAHLDELDGEGWAPMHRAVDFDFDSANQAGVLPVLVWTRLLLMLGADPGRRTAAGQTPSDIAAGYGPEATKLFARVVAQWAKTR